MLKTESYKKGVLYSTGLNIVAKGIQFLNTLIIAYYFGAGTGTDMYFFVIGIAILITSGMINSFDLVLIIPQAMKLREVEGESSSQKFLNFFIFLYLAVGIIISAVIIIAPQFFYNTFSKYPPSVLLEYRHLLYAGSILISFLLINNFLGAILNSYKYFTINILTSLLTSTVSIIITVLFHRQMGIAGTLFAVAISYCINFIFLIAVFIFKLRWKFTAVEMMRDKIVWGNLALMQLNILPVWVRNYFTLFLLTGLGTGIISSVNLSQQAAAIIDTLIISQILSVAGIKFNELYAKGNMQELNNLFIKITDYVFILICPVVLLTFFYAGEIATIIFQRGYMDKSSVANVALCLKYLILLLPFSMLNGISTRIFSATQVIRQGIVYGMIAHTVFLLLTVVFINKWQLMGYLYSLLAGYSVLIFLFSRLYKIKLKLINFDKVLIFGLKQILINLAIAWPVHFFLKDVAGIKNNIGLCIYGISIQMAVLAIAHRNQPEVVKVRNFIGNLRTKKYLRFNKEKTLP